MLLTGSESERRPPEEGSGVSPASNVSHVLGSSATGNPEDAVQQTNVKGQKMGFDMTADAGGTCVTNLISLPVSKLFDSVELTKSEDYDKALSDGLVASRFGCSTESLVCLLAPYVSRLCEVTNRGIDKYLSSRENAFRKVDDELVEFGALVDADAAASAALAASALSGEEAGATDCSLHKNGGEKSVLQQRHHKAVKWSFKKLRWLADEELEGSLAGLEGLVAFKSCVISEAIDASLRQGQVQCSVGEGFFAVAWSAFPSAFEVLSPFSARVPSDRVASFCRGKAVSSGRLPKMTVPRPRLQRALKEMPRRGSWSLD